VTDSPNPSRAHKARLRLPRQALPEAGEGLEDEVKILRALIRLLAGLVDEGRPLPELLQILDRTGRLSTQLATLLKTQRSLGEERGVAAALNQALAEVLAEMSAEGKDSAG
jgi:hypothetical protein